MQIKSIQALIASSFVLALAMNVPAAAAEPLAAMPPLNHVGQQMLESHGRTAADLEANIPSGEEVGIPIYPGALYTGAMEGGGMNPSVVLASADSAEQVHAWYADQAGLTYDENFKLFYMGDEYLMMESESVFIQDISENPTASAGGLMFVMDGLKSQITISYRPKNGEDHE